MGYTDDDLDRAARRFEQLADELDPGAVAVEHTDDLRAVAVAAEAVAAEQAHLREAVAMARARGRSWNEIARSLGVSRQAARQRFGDAAAA